MSPAALAVIGTLIATLAGYAGARFARRKEKADAAKIITDSALEMMTVSKADAAALKIELAQVVGSVTVLTEQVGKLNTTVLGLQAENAALLTRVEQLEGDKLQLQDDNSKLRDRVAVLESQLRDLGHTPANGTSPLKSIESKVDELLDHDAERDVPGLRLDPSAPNIQEETA